MNSIEKKQIRKAVNLTTQMGKNPVGIVTRFMNMERQLNRVVNVNKIVMKRLDEEKVAYEKLLRFSGGLAAYALSIREIGTLRGNNGPMTIKMEDSDRKLMDDLTVSIESNEADDPVSITLSDAREYKEDCLLREMLKMADTLSLTTGYGEWAKKAKYALNLQFGKIPPKPAPEPPKDIDVPDPSPPDPYYCHTHEKAKSECGCVTGGPSDLYDYTKENFSPRAG